MNGRSRSGVGSVADLSAARVARDSAGMNAQRVVAAWEVALAAYGVYLAAGGRSVGTVTLRLTYLRRLARAVSCGPWQVTPAEVVAFVGDPAWSPETRKSARAAVVGFYRYGLEAGELEADPSRMLAPVRVPPGAPRPVPAEVLRAAFARVRTDRERLLLLFAAYAGLRRAEIARVHPHDFTADGLLVRGKGGRRRIVPVHHELAAAVRRELELRARGTHGTGWRFDAHVAVDSALFPGRYGRGVSADNVGVTLSRLLGPGWSGHTLRHRFASSAYAAERDLRAVQELLGHSKPETTARYVQVPTDAKRAAVAAVGLELAG